MSINRYICISLYFHYRASSSPAKRFACQVGEAVNRGAGTRVAVAIAQTPRASLRPVAATPARRFNSGDASAVAAMIRPARSPSLVARLRVSVHSTRSALSGWWASPGIRGSCRHGTGPAGDELARLRPDLEPEQAETFEVGRGVRAGAGGVPVPGASPEQCEAGARETGSGSSLAHRTLVV